MTLIAILEQVVRGNNTVSFKREMSNLSIRMTRKDGIAEGVKTVKIVDGFLPLRDDHMDERHIVGCIEFLLKKINS